MTRRAPALRVWVAAIALAVLGAVPVAVPGAAAPKPIPATLSDIATDAGDLTGVLTLRSGGGAVEVDDASLHATVGDEDVPLEIDPVTQAPRRAMLVVDTSGSMGEAGMAVARDAAASFLEAAPKDVRIGLVSFANTSGVDVPLTTDRARLLRSVNALESDGETSLYAAIRDAVTALGASGDRSILLLSDGGDTIAKDKARAQKSAVSVLKRAGIRAEIVAFKTDETDTSVLDRFAAAGGGSVAQAGDDKAVKAAFTAAATALESQVRWRLTAPETLSGPQKVVLTGTAGGRAFRAASMVDLGDLRASTTDDPSAPAPTVVTSATPESFAAPATSWMKPAAVAALFLGILGLVMALVAPAFQTRRAARVAGVETYLPATESLTRDRPKASGAGALTTSLVAYGDKRMEGRSSASKTMALIERADLALRPGEWWVLRVVSLIVGAALFMLLLGGGWGRLVGLALGLVVGGVVPALVLRFLAKRRAKKFDTQLPDALSLVASSLGSGFSLPQALDAVAKDSADPLAKEFSRALAEARIGSDMAEALERVGTRMDSQNMRWTSMAITIQREVGGNLAETLRTTAATIRDRASLKRHVQALSAEGKLSAYILIALPIFIFVYMLFVNKPYIALLWTTLPGIAMCIAGAVFLAFGIWWMSKVVTVEV
ncbi:type II secretion system F family protein [Janibacter sp. G1551]|uniref:type II secretion system F family protein n=1 Tax=Janibacter sp. G1551 TaxID=3420440 RepID=UPI003CFD465D